MGVKEQIIFPEIDYDKIDTLRGLDITITTTAQNDEEGRALLTALRFPFRAMPTAADEAPKVKPQAPVEEAPAEEAIAEEQPAAAEEQTEEAVETAPETEAEASKEEAPATQPNDDPSVEEAEGKEES
jgi:hypothetical protein